MDAFESLIKILLENDGLWVRSSVNVELTKKEKINIGRPSSPRWELDLVAYNASKNEIYVIECKSYIDSPGADQRDLSIDGKNARRYKLFTEEKLRKVVFMRLKKDLIKKGFCNKNTKILLGLAAGKIAGKKEDIKKYFEDRKMIFYSPDWIKKNLELMKAERYKNNIAYIVSKILLR